MVAVDRDETDNGVRKNETPSPATDGSGEQYHLLQKRISAKCPRSQITYACLRRAIAE